MLAALIAALGNGIAHGLVSQLPTIVGWVEQVIARGRQVQAAKAQAAADDAAIDAAIPPSPPKP